MGWTPVDPPPTSHASVQVAKSVTPRSDRTRKIVVESGSAGLRQWRSYRRNLTGDFRIAFGEAPGALQAVAFMTDGNNTQSRLSTWHGDIALH